MKAARRVAARIAEATHVQSEAKAVGRGLAVPELLIADPLQLVETEMARFVAELKQSLEPSRGAVQPRGVRKDRGRFGRRMW